MSNGAERVRDMVQDAEGISEIQPAIGKRYIADAGKMKFDVSGVGEVLSRDLQRLWARVEKMQPADAGCYESSPAAGPATRVQALCVARQIGPGENPEILIEKPLTFLCGQIRRVLREGRPFKAKSLGSPRVDIVHDRPAQL